MFIHWIQDWTDKWSAMRYWHIVAGCLGAWIGGIVVLSIGVSLRAVVIGVMASLMVTLLLLIIYRRRWVGIVMVWCVAMMAGSFYMAIWKECHQGASVEYNKEQIIEGEVSSYPRASAWHQSFQITMADGGGVVSVRLSKWYQIRWGDYISVRGTVSPLEEATEYLLVDGVVGVMNNPAVISIEEKQSNTIRGALFAVRERMVRGIDTVLNADQSALAAGIILGQESTTFPYELREAMKASGTTHLVALSGFNITVLINAVLLMLSSFLSRRRSVVVIIIAVVGFVVMTGAEASVVRAACMGLLLVIAHHYSRVYSITHAGVAAAWVMLLHNPLLIAYDIGFVLSFVALCGIVWIGPIIASMVKTRGKGTTLIKKIVAETWGAQIMVLPLLAYYFGSISIAGFVSNIIIVPMIPFAMAGVVGLSLVGVVYSPVAHLVVIAVAPIVEVIVSMINVWGNIPLIDMAWPGWAVVMYWGLGALLVRQFGRRDDTYIPLYGA